MFQLTRRQTASIVASAFVCFLSLTALNALAQSETGAPKFVRPHFADGPAATSQNDTVADGDSEQEGELLPSLSEPEDAQNIGDELLSETEANDSEDEEAETDSEEESAQASVDVTARDPNAVEREPYDVYKENGIYFEGWEKPEVALVFTGIMNGYIEPCGCAGMDRMKGGLSRRCTFVKQLREEMGWNAALIDAGQLTVGFGIQEELKFDMAVNALQLMKYDAVGIGLGELRFPAYFLLTFTAPTSSTSQSLFTSANIGIYGYHPTYALPYKIIKRGGKKIAVVSVVCNDESLKRRDENILFEEPEKKLREILPKLRDAKCDASVLIVHGPEAETAALAKKFPNFDYVVTSDGPSEPPAEAKKINGSQTLIEVGEKGKYAVVVGLFADGSVKYQRIALDSRYESSPDVTLLMKDYQSILKGLIVSKGYKGGLGINPAKAPQADLLGKYVGSKKCQSCHEDAYRVWAKSKHATAWKSLTETANPPRDFDPECIGCHVVGWDGLQHFPYIDGFSSEQATPALANVGCESCHGAGERHIALETGDNEAAQLKVRKAMRLGDSVKKVCFSCHDGDNSPEFEFDAYYPLIEHSEADDEDEDEDL